MLNYDFRTYIAEGTEFYGMSIKNLDALEYHEKTASFPSNLLSFLDLDTESLAPLLKKISDELWSLTLTQDKRFAQEALSELAELEECHIYFSYLRLDWTWRISQALALGGLQREPFAAQCPAADVGESETDAGADQRAICQRS